VADKLERRTANVKIGERPARNSPPEGETKSEEKPGKVENTQQDAAPRERNDRPVLGLKLSELTPQIANERNLKGVRGLFVQDVDQAGIAYDAGVQKSMVIQRINRQSVATIEDFERVINALKPGDPIVLHVSAYNGEKVTQSIVQFTFQ
jgi:S1-C subfamily serine protease